MPQTTDAAEFWNARYQENERIWSGNPNPVLVTEVGALAPGHAADLGCGEGADAVWLARRGWTVTAVDISSTALARAADHAADAGVADRITWVQHDLGRWTPDETYDLVSAQFFQSPIDLPSERILATAAGALRPGGTLLVVSHAAFPPWARHHDHDVDVHFPTPDELVDAIGLRAQPWVVDVAEVRPRAATGPDGQNATLVDTVVRVRRGDDVT
ncbi:class I SAM-dependent methyltransferase [Jiangella asiatica]|uniref:Class I SAM-dependent methyltransferase n=1 Tax=Jiangella asiatica TaxID=2530372 RepID=A0A4R5DN10_9ACTN|nr:class I SAM-dependent methyltransferase [Jiangella asiatica]